VQLKATLRTLPRAWHPLQDRTALCTPRNRASARQIDGPRPKTVISFRRWSSAWLFSATLSRLVIAILISMLSIFCRHKLLPSTRRIVYPRRDLPQVSSNSTGRLSSGGGFLCGPVMIACSEGIFGIHRR
jgi:hypothetical protein